jgi:hypothetical protein
MSQALSFSLIICHCEVPGKHDDPAPATGRAYLAGTYPSQASTSTQKGSETRHALLMEIAGTGTTHFGSPCPSPPPEESSRTDRVAGSFPRPQKREELKAKLIELIDAHFPASPEWHEARSSFHCREVSFWLSGRSDYVNLSWPRADGYIWPRQVA